MSALSLSKLKKRPVAEPAVRPKKKIDRFDGLSEEEVQKYTLPDILDKNLDMVFVGINPGLVSAHRGRYYAGPGNHFYKLLHESKLTPRLFSHEEDYKLPQCGIGLTNIVPRATRSSSDLKRSEIKEGARLLEQKLKFFQPKIAIFNGKGIYEVYANKTSKSEFHFGLQLQKIGESAVWVVPSSSGRCAHFPRMVDKLRFYLALNKFLLHVKGELLEFDVGEFLFEGKCKPSVPTTSRMWRRKNLSAFAFGGRVANKNTIDLDISEEMIAIVNNSEFIVNDMEAMRSSRETEESSCLMETESAGMKNGLATICPGLQYLERRPIDNNDMEYKEQQEEDKECYNFGREKLQIKQEKEEYSIETDTSSILMEVEDAGSRHSIKREYANCTKQQEDKNCLMNGREELQIKQEKEEDFEENRKTAETLNNLRNENTGTIKDLVGVDSDLTLNVYHHLIECEETECKKQQEEDRKCSVIGREKLQIKQEKEEDFVETEVNLGKNRNIEEKRQTAEMLKNLFLIENENTGTRNDLVRIDSGFSQSMDHHVTDSEDIDSKVKQEKSTDSLKIGGEKLRQKKEDTFDDRRNLSKHPEIEKNKHTADFVSLIKQRISEKNSSEVAGEVKEGKKSKKLKYANLKTNRGTAKFDGTKSTSKEMPSKDT